MPINLSIRLIQLIKLLRPPLVLSSGTLPLHSSQKFYHRPRRRRIFDKGTFSEGATFSLTDWLVHVSKEVIAKNFQIDISHLDEIPEKEHYLFKGIPTSLFPEKTHANVCCMVAPPPADNIEEDMVVPNDTPEPYTYAWSKVQGIQKPGGSIKYSDTRTFQVSRSISTTEVTVEVGGMRCVHSNSPRSLNSINC